MFLFVFSINELPLKIILSFVSLFFLTGSVIIFSKYKIKLKKIEKAIKYYNNYGLDIDYLKYFLIDPCSILVLKYILIQVNERNALVYIKKNAINFNLSEETKI